MLVRQIGMDGKNVEFFDKRASVEEILSPSQIAASFTLEASAPCAASGRAALARAFTADAAWRTASCQSGRRSAAASCTPQRPGAIVRHEAQ
jgi:hypothetical protein